MKVPTHSPLFVTKELLETRYQGAEMIFVAGSVVRGEATAHSDLDLVVVYPKIKAAYRESFAHKDWPVEAFIHDMETLRYFFKQMDPSIARPTLAEMVAEGHEIPGPTKLSEELKEMASDTLSAGPPELSAEEIQDRRYQLSELLDDLRAPRNSQELIAVGTVLYNDLADFYFRSRRMWTGSGKSVLKRMKRVDPAFSRKFGDAFDQLFVSGQAARVMQITEELLVPHGGYMFEGYHRDVPSSWRLKG